MKNKDKVVVKVDNVKKTFKIPLESSNGLKQKIINTLKGRKGYREFSPLNGVSFEIKDGEFFGIVGRNGSGKSTLLKTIAGIYTPNQGSVHIDGSLVPFIELGVGFNPELTGRENVFLNGALLGFSRSEIESMYDDIVDFAELHDFMEERLKNYSSGMQVRLAFSVAVQARGDILLLDEVLAVGDEAFQRKCYAYFDQLKKDKKTVILVTHDMSAVRRFCTRAVLIHDGAVQRIGSPDAVATDYSKENDERYVAGVVDKNNSDKTDIQANDTIQATVENGSGESIKQFIEGEVLKLKVSWDMVDVKYLGVALHDTVGRDIFSPNSYKDNKIVITDADKSVVYNLSLNLAPGEYHFQVALFGKHDKDVKARLHQGPRIIVTRNTELPEFVGLTRLDYEWKK